MDPMPGAIEAVQALSALGKYELYILSECFGEHFIHFGSESFPDWDSVIAFFTGLK